MKATGKCPKCGSTEIASDTRAQADKMLELTVGRHLKPDAVIFREWTRAKLSAWVCTDCGFVELYADEPKKLKSTPPS